MNYFSGNRWLTMEEMKVNAAYVWNYFQARGWTLEAVCGMLGNMQSESHINPSIWQGLDEGNLTGGYGIVQWTPATKFFNWCDSYTPAKNRYSMISNLERIIYEVDNHLQWIKTTEYDLTFLEFTQSTETPYYLAMAFLKNYERPADPTQPWRGEQANDWYTFLSNEIPPTPKKKKSGKSYLYVRKRRLFFV
jgi:hypothetical protein